MKRKEKTTGRFLAILLVCTMLAAALAACGLLETTDKTDLKSAISSAETIKAASDYNDYTQESRTVFEYALDAAKTVNDDTYATQAEIDEATSSLLAAISQLSKDNVPIATDKTALLVAIAEAEAIKAVSDYDDYAQEDRTALEDALDAAKTTNDDADATQDEIDEVAALLLAAIALFDGNEGGEEPDFDRYAGLLMVWQAGAAKDGAITRSFVELYNNSGDDIDLSGYSLQYAKATGNDWTVIPLEGTIAAHTSFLVLGNEGTSLANGRLFFEDGDADFEAEFALDNDGFKLCLVHSTALIDAANPFDVDGEGTIVDGYVDFVGANNKNMSDAAEGSPVAKMSKQQSARRTDLTDTDDNSVDFVNIDYRVADGSDGITDEDMQNYRPKNQAYGAWNPVTFESLEILD